MPWLTKNLKWCKLHWGWYTSPSHASLDLFTLSVGLYAMLCANSWGRKEDGSGDVVNAAGLPFTAESLALSARARPDQIRAAMAVLVGVETIKRKRDRWVFPNLQKWQESPVTRRTREWRDRQENVPETFPEQSPEHTEERLGNGSEDRRQKTEEKRRKEEEESPTIGGPIAAPPVLLFPCQGDPKSWALTQAQVYAWQSSYPHLDVEAECRKAWNYIDANPAKKKTARGCKRFLVGWLNRAVDHARPAPSNHHPKRLTQSERLAQIAMEIPDDDDKTDDAGDSGPRKLFPRSGP